MKVLDVFSGMGGFSRGLENAGMKTVAFCEIDPFCRRVLKAHWPDVPVFEDIRKIRKQDVGPVDVIAGGFPCQDASVANAYGQGTDGERTGLFREIIRLADDLEPEAIFMENVTELLNRGFGDVLGALAEIGYDAQWDCISASALGAPHKRERLFIHAYPGSQRRQGFKPDNSLFVSAFKAFTQYSNNTFDAWEELDRSEPVLRSINGLSIGMERRRLSMIGNAVVPQIPEMIGVEILKQMEATQ